MASHRAPLCFPNSFQLAERSSHDVCAHRMYTHTHIKVVKKYSPPAVCAAGPRLHALFSSCHKNIFVYHTASIQGHPSYVYKTKAVVQDFFSLFFYLGSAGCSFVRCSLVSAPRVAITIAGCLLKLDSVWRRELRKSEAAKCGFSPDDGGLRGPGAAAPPGGGGGGGRLLAALDRAGAAHLRTYQDRVVCWHRV
jgi:hypothetical protein